jgi:hypothetical protein
MQTLSALIFSITLARPVVANDVIFLNGQVRLQDGAVQTGHIGNSSIRAHG